MNKRKGCGSAKTKYNLSDQKAFHSDAKVIIALLKKQPQSLEELCKNAKIHRATFFRMRRLLIGNGILKEIEKGYALTFYEDLYGKMDDALREFKEKGYEVVGLDDLANKVGEEPNQIRELAYQAAHKYGLKVGERSYRKDRIYISQTLTRF